MKVSEKLDIVIEKYLTKNSFLSLRGAKTTWQSLLSLLSTLEIASFDATERLLAKTFYSLQ